MSFLASVERQQLAESNQDFIKLAITFQHAAGTVGAEEDFLKLTLPPSAKVRVDSWDMTIDRLLTTIESNEPFTVIREVPFIRHITPYSINEVRKLRNFLGEWSYDQKSRSLFAYLPIDMQAAYDAGAFVATVHSCSAYLRVSHEWSITLIAEKFGRVPLSRRELEKSWQ